MANDWVQFTQYIRPNGLTHPVKLLVPEGYAIKAQRFLDAGGQFSVEVITGERVVFWGSMGDEDIVTEVGRLDAMLDSIIKVIERSYESIGERNG